MPLHQLCLQIATLRLGAPSAFLADALHAPAPEALDAALATLRDIGALDASDGVTPLGVHLAALPVDVHAGKLLLFGAMFRCARPALTLAAAVGARSPFLHPLEKREGSFLFFLLFQFA